MIGTNINEAIALLLDERVVAIPTETVYGLAGNAYSAKAVAAIFEIKNRPSFDPLIIHTSSFSRVQEFVLHIPEQAALLAASLMPGPLTLLLDKAAVIPDIVTAGSPRVAIRIPSHPLCLKLLEALPFPLAAPSANPFGYISPTTAQHVFDQLGDKVPYILDGGPAEVGLESTILGFEGDQAIIYRKGGTAVEVIESLIGPVVIRPHSTSNPQAPGMLKSHYAPKAGLIIGNIEEEIAKHRHKKIGTISFYKKIAGIPPAQQVILSPKQDLKEAAFRLFAGMRQLDQMSLDMIIAELVPEKGLGRAINDRLRRAAVG
jgi:L-threonylcarbamoyladenylate synthase